MSDGYCENERGRCGLPARVWFSGVTLLAELGATFAWAVRRVLELDPGTV